MSGGIGLGRRVMRGGKGGRGVGKSDLMGRETDGF